MNLTQSAFTERLAAKCGVTMTEANRLVTEFKEFIYTELGAGNSVQFSGFGKFSVSHRAARLGVNPRQPTVKITIPELNTVKFKAGEAFKEAVKLKQ